MAKEKKGPNIQHEKCKKIVITFLKKGIHISWAKELKIAKKLLADFPQIGDWNGIPEENRTNSLAYFLLPQGKTFIEKFQITKDFVAPELTVYNIGNDVYGENKSIGPSKPKTLFEFLKTDYGKR
jgi:hypothetical protein